jgi:uncharacterized membrane protein YdbT with pleckstrin-like domain
MGYVKENLISGETLSYSGRLHWVASARLFLLSVIFALAGLAVVSLVFSKDNRGLKLPDRLGLAALAPLVLAAGCAGTGLLRLSSSEFAVTNKRVILKVGLFHKRTLEIFLGKIESIGVEQTILGRILGYGQIVVRGTGGTFETFDHISRPLEFRKQVQEQIGRQSV